jgi:hypothetical protein
LGSGDSYYYGSSDHPSFLFAKRNGKLKKYILGSFDEELNARIAETFAIKKLREGGMNLYNRNEGGGGKSGPLNDYRNIDNKFRETIELIANKRKFPETNVKSTARKISDKIIQGLGEKAYDVFEENVNTLSKYNYIQVRHKRLDKKHVRDLCDAMEDNPIKFKEKTNPLIVVVDDRDVNNINHFVIGGNHRIAAAIEAGWDTFPTVYINFSEFEYNLHNAKVFGTNENSKNSVINKAIQEEDIKEIIEEHHRSNPSLHPASVEFRESFLNDYRGDQLTEKKLNINLNNYIKKYNERQLAASYNFHQYDDKELKAIKEHLTLREEFSDALILSDEVSTLQNNGIGGILNMLGSNYNNSIKFKTKTKKTGIIFARYAKPSDIEHTESSLTNFVNAMKIAGFDTEDNTVWKNKNGYVVKIIILPYKHESDDHPVTWKSFKKAVDLSIKTERTKLGRQAA